MGDLADSRFQSAIGLLPDKRPISSGQQDFPTKEKNWPLTKPIPKIESLIQSTGEATYVSDIDHEGVLHAAFALSTEGNATIFKTDKARALVRSLNSAVYVLTFRIYFLLVGDPRSFGCLHRGRYPGYE